MSQSFPSAAHSSSASLDSNYSQVVNSRLPPIDALQSRVSSQQIPSSNMTYLNSASASMGSYTAGGNATVAAMANYSPYPQMMFPMSGLPDMSALNSSALQGLAMQGLHNPQQYYRAAAAADAAATIQNSKPN